MSDTETPYTKGDTLGRYRIARPMGSGGMGTVYEARHVDLDKRVALKVLHPDVARNPVARARFLREGQAAARIHHPNVVEVFDVGLEDGVIFLVMEYLEGEDLAQRLEHSGRMSLDAVCDLMLPVCLAVAAAHEAGVVHRDLKPENIFLARTREGIEPKLLDFGISKLPHARSAGLTLEATALGTPQYMSPEQATRASQVDSRSDLYTLGLILYECAVGRRAFDGPDVYPILHAIVEGSFTFPRDLVPEIPEDFESVVLRAMALSPDARHPDAMSLGRELLPFASSEARSRFAPRFASFDTLTTLRPLANPPRALSSTIERASLEIPIALSTRRKAGRARTVWILGAIATALVLAAALVPARRARGVPTPPNARMPLGLEGSTALRAAPPEAPPETLSPSVTPVLPAASVAPAEAPSGPARLPNRSRRRPPRVLLSRPPTTPPAPPEPVRGANNAPIVE